MSRREKASKDFEKARAKILSAAKGPSKKHAAKRRLTDLPEVKRVAKILDDGRIWYRCFDSDDVWHRETEAPIQAVDGPYAVINVSLTRAAGRAR